MTNTSPTGTWKSKFSCPVPLIVTSPWMEDSVSGTRGATWTTFELGSILTSGELPTLTVESPARRTVGEPPMVTVPLTGRGFDEVLVTRTPLMFDATAEPQPVVMSRRPIEPASATRTAA
jgi:hypothetical protein